MSRPLLVIAALWSFFALGADAALDLPTATAAVAPVDEGTAVAAVDAGVASPVAEVATDALTAVAPSEAPALTEDAEEDRDDASPDTAEDEGSDERAAMLADAGIHYSQDLTDEVLTRLWVEDPAALGSISVGLAEAGRVINAVPVPEGAAWQVVDPANAWGARESVDFVTAAANDVRAQFPDAPALRINHIGRKDGGHLRPHRSHQSGRDVDLGFFFPNGEDPGRLSKRRELAMDLKTNWALIKALLTHGDVQFILVDKNIIARLRDYALKQGDDKAWLDRVFGGGEPLVRHARRHRDHFHVRYYAARSQELGRRIQPLLAKQPEQNLVIHRVKRGDTLGGLASKYRSTVKLIQKANGMRTTALSIGRTLNIPLRGPCTNCPVAPPLVVPPRCLPPEPPTKS